MNITQPAVPLLAVYLQKDGSIEKEPVDFLFLSDEGVVTAGQFDSSGFAENDITNSGNCLGIERVGEPRDWTEEIARLKEV